MIGLRVKPTDKCIEKFGRHYTKGKVYIVTANTYEDDGEVLADEESGRYIPYTSEHFSPASPIMIGGE